MWILAFVCIDITYYERSNSLQQQHPHMAESSQLLLPVLKYQGSQQTNKKNAPSTLPSPKNYKQCMINSYSFLFELLITIILLLTQDAVGRLKLLHHAAHLQVTATAVLAQLTNSWLIDRILSSEVSAYKLNPTFCDRDLHTLSNIADKSDRSGHMQ